MAFIASNNVLYVFQQSLNVGVFITGQSQPTPRGDCPGGYFQVSRTACFRHSQCPDRSFCWFTPTRTHGICCPYCKYKVHAILVVPLQISVISRIICIWCSFFLFLLFLGFFFQFGCTKKIYTSKESESSLTIDFTTLSDKE